MSTTTVPPSDPLTWKQADVDVHVATRAGEFAGFVEFDGSAHVVRDARGADLGAFDSLDAAFRALDDAQQPAPPRAPRLAAPDAPGASLNRTSLHDTTKARAARLLAPSSV